MTESQKHAKLREELIEAKTALKYTASALQNASSMVTADQLQHSIVPLLSDLKGFLAPPAQATAQQKVLYFVLPLYISLLSIIIVCNFVCNISLY